jgi:hypothetical protein
VTLCVHGVGGRVSETCKQFSFVLAAAAAMHGKCCCAWRGCRSTDSGCLAIASVLCLCVMQHAPHSKWSEKNQIPGLLPRGALWFKDALVCTCSVSRPPKFCGKELPEAWCCVSCRWGCACLSPLHAAPVDCHGFSTLVPNRIMLHDIACLSSALDCVVLVHCACLSAACQACVVSWLLAVQVPFRCGIHC